MMSQPGASHTPRPGSAPSLPCARSSAFSTPAAVGGIISEGASLVWISRQARERLGKLAGGRAERCHMNHTHSTITTELNYKI